MKFSAVVPFLIAGALAATPVLKHPAPVERDVATITSALSNIQEKTQALSDAISNFDGNVLSIAGPSADNMKAIEDAQAAIEPIEPITLQEAIGIQGVTQGLTDTVSTLIDNLIAKKDALVAAGVGPIIAQSLTSQQGSSGKLADTIVSKVPQDVQELARQLSAGISENVQRGVEAYADQAGTGGGAAPSSAAPASSAAAPTMSEAPASSASAPAASAPASSAGSAMASASHAATSAHASSPASPTPTPPAAFTGAASMQTAAAIYVLAAAVAVAAF